MITGVGALLACDLRHVVRLDTRAEALTIVLRVRGRVARWRRRRLRTQSRVVVVAVLIEFDGFGDGWR